MNTLKIVFRLWLLALLPACTGTQPSVVPLTATLPVDDGYTLIWQGVSEAYRFQDGHWVRDSSYDYVFDVIQKRYATHWQSVKHLHRLHPAYDGRAGDRDQAMYFALHYQAQDSQWTAKLHTSLGPGTGRSDLAFREQTLEITGAGISSRAPYSHLRITQHYHYEAGLLTETVLLYRQQDGTEIPFMKNEERAHIYLRGQLDGPPTP